ncbi:MAG: ornithine cyclodeaminase family protein [Rubrivivax sp.]
MTRVYSAAEVHAALPWPALVETLRTAFLQGAQVPLRHAHALSPADTLLLMPAWNDDLVVTKLVTVMPGAPHTVQASLVALDRRTGEVRALMDGEAVTLRRTAAASALAAQHLARADACTLLVVGSGRLSSWMARAHVALRPGLRRVMLWGRRTEAAAARAQELREAFQAECGAAAPPVEVAPDLEAAAREADIVCCATTSTTPLVRGAWLRPGTHLDLVGGFRRDMREADDEAVCRARVVVDTRAGALAEAGDLTEPLARGLIERSHVRAELAELLADPSRGRADANETTLFKSVGTALEDLAAAQCVLARA